MKRFMPLTVCALVLTLGMAGCNGGGPPIQPTPTPTNTAVPPTATATETPIPATPTSTPTVTPTPIAPTTDPNVESYKLPKSVGVNQIAYDAAWPWPRHGGVLDQFTTKELFDELSSYGINAIRLWLSVPYNDGADGTPIYEDMAEVWGHPGIDTIVVIFKHPHNESFIEPGCNSPRVTTDNLNEPTYEIATYLYENFGDQPKTIIITAPEIDNMARGYDCEALDDALWEDWDKTEQCLVTEGKSRVECANEMYLERMDALIANAERRQREVERARAEHPDAVLLVGSSITVSQFKEVPEYYNKYALRDYIPYMEISPDWIGLSQGASGGRDFAFPISETERLTGYPRDRMFVDQVYMNEKYAGVQYNLIKPAIQVAFSWDVDMALIWMWKQGWRSYNDRGQPENKGMWQWVQQAGDPPSKTEYGEPTSGMDVIRELHPDWIEPTPTPADTPTETPTPEPTDTPTPEPTPTPSDPCAHCPEPGTIGCTISYDICAQCWEDCGSPIEPTNTPTPTRTPTPTGGVVLPTATPAPPGCEECPPKGSIGCTISERICCQCWADCGEPCDTPTPRPTSTPTPTPTPQYSSNPLVTVEAEGSPTHCTWVATHTDSGLQVAHDVPECAPFNISFPEVGWWSLEMTAQYLHGYNGVQEPCLDNEGVPIADTVCGDLDEDGWYEFRTFKMIEVLAAPEVPIVS